MSTSSTPIRLLSCGDSIGIGDYVMIRGLVKRSDLNSKVAKVVHIPSTDSERVGVNILGDDVSVKISNLDQSLPVLVTFHEDMARLDLSKAICQYIPDHHVFVPHRQEVVDVSDTTLHIRHIPWNEDTRVLFNLMSKYGAPVLSKDEGYLGGIKRDLRDVAIFSASEQREILQASKIEDSSALLGITNTENEPKPWYQALKDLVNTYKKSVDQETKDPNLLLVTDHMRREVGQEFSIGRVETVAHYFADGCIPKYYFGLMSLLMIQPSVNDLNKCELRRSIVGGVGGLGCFLRPSVRAKPGEILSLYPCRLIGKYYSVKLEGGNVQRNHHIMAQVRDSSEWQHFAATDPMMLIEQAKRYSVTLAPAAGCALMASSPPSKVDDFDPAWIAHMANSTRDGIPPSNCTLVPNLLGGFWWGIAAVTNIAPGDELIVDYGHDWFNQPGHQDP